MNKDLNTVTKDLKEVVETSRQCREAQRKYFANRTQDSLSFAKLHEKKLDALLYKMNLEYFGEIVLPNFNSPGGSVNSTKDLFDNVSTQTEYIFPPGKNISKCRYNPTEDRLEVLFSSGQVYHYFGEDLFALWTRWVSDKDSMKFFMDNIRMKLKYKKV